MADLSDSVRARHLAAWRSSLARSGCGATLFFEPVAIDLLQQKVG
jgi:hypothetical protein